MTIKRIEVDGESKTYKVPLWNKKFLIISYYLPNNYVEDLFNNKTIIFNYNKNGKELSIKFRGYFSEEYNDSINVLLEVIDDFKFSNISKEEIYFFFQNGGEDLFEEFYKKVNIKSGTDIYYGIEEEERLINEAKSKVEESLSWYKDNKETLDTEKGKMYFHHLKRIFDKKFIKLYCEKE